MCPWDLIYLLGAGWDGEELGIVGAIVAWSPRGVKSGDLVLRRSASGESDEALLVELGERERNGSREYM